MTRTTEFENFSEEKSLKITQRIEKRIQGTWFEIIKEDAEKDKYLFYPYDHPTKSQLQELNKAIEEFLK